MNPGVVADFGTSCLPGRIFAACRDFRAWDSTTAAKPDQIADKVRLAAKVLSGRKDLH